MNDNIEMLVLANLVINQDQMLMVRSIINENMFIFKPYKEIYSNLIEMYDEGIKIDFTTLKTYLLENGSMDRITKKEFDAFISNTIDVRFFNIESYCYLLVSKYLRRELILNFNANIDFLERENKNPIDIINNTIEFLTELNPKNEIVLKNSESIQEYINKVNNGLIADIPTGFSSIDEIFKGFGLGDMNIIAGRSKIGKTTFVCNILYNQAFLLDFKVRFYSLEMKREKLLLYLVSKHIQADSEWIVNNTLTNNKYIEYCKFMDTIDNKGLTIIEDLYDLDDIKNDIMKSEEKIIYIDYNELIDVKGANEPLQKLDKIAKVFTKLAKQHNKCIIMIQQFRLMEPKDNIFPKANVTHINYKAGLKDASKILLIDGNLGDNVRDIIIGYNRYGKIGNVELFFNGQYSTFSEVYL